MTKVEIVNKMKEKCSELITHIGVDDKVETKFITTDNIVVFDDLNTDGKEGFEIIAVMTIIGEAGRQPLYQTAYNSVNAEVAGEDYLNLLFPTKEQVEVQKQQHEMQMAMQQAQMQNATMPDMVEPDSDEEAVTETEEPTVEEQDPTTAA